MIPSETAGTSAWKETKQEVPLLLRRIRKLGERVRRLRSQRRSPRNVGSLLMLAAQRDTCYNKSFRGPDPFLLQMTFAKINPLSLLLAL